MQISLFADYSFRLLIYLGNHPRRKVTVAEVAEVYDISRHHLVKVAHLLAKKNFVHSMRGKGGGLVLARSPDLIEIVDILRCCEKSLASLGHEALQDAGVTEHYPMKRMLLNATDSFFSCLEQYTLDDLLTPMAVAEDICHTAKLEQCKHEN